MQYIKNDMANNILFISGKSGLAAYFKASDIFLPGDMIVGRWMNTGDGAAIPMSSVQSISSKDAYDEEVDRIAEAARAKAEADKARIKQVVESVDNLEEQMKGKIVIFVEFRGTLAETKTLTRAEKDIVRSGLATEIQQKVGMDKPLFGPFKAHDVLKKQIAAWREQIKGFGIPFFGRGMTVIDVRLIPEIEALFDKIDAKLPELVEDVMREYPDAITAEKVGTGPLHNPKDYRPVSQLKNLFSLTRKWMPSFDVPDILKEVDMARWEAERQRSIALWAEVRQNGVALLREQVATMTDRLVDAVTGKEDGTKRKFYASTITNMTEFFEQFENRNLAGDKDLAAQVERLKALIGNTPVESFKTNDALRAKVQKEGSLIQQTLKGMLVDARARQITFEEEN